MILMCAALVRLDGKLPASLEPFQSLLRQWAIYLQQNLPDPGDQLCTDDFTGPSPHNVNLAAKGIIAIQAYAQYLLDPKDPLQPFFRDVASGYQAYWEAQSLETDHFELEFQLSGTWSTK